MERYSFAQSYILNHIKVKGGKKISIHFIRILIFKKGLSL